ncbi:enoyl-ACP reductase FabI [Frigoriflavimonas asaccharolytica]|uniref:Enoyl-[acyl-carrier protein] reductase I n=1 Tax=Frigoriflavimonas asaccharolytica TaxID=2735899 RepID=A0A8J8GA00_9FLAO|nr:SDR family oxidoreductase [Frigoriflavimonas asaccharolytica]NRS92065.1 enoyl-[acyl-carrier protein] reductase I [Frigoriflavimonas asaccharolytica]
MVENKQKYWAIILGGSSGLGLASAKKLAQDGFNICIVHRNARSEMAEILQEFEKIKSQNISFVNFNLDALNIDSQQKIISEFKEVLGEAKVKILVHSIAKGNLKAMVSEGDSILSSDDFMITFQAMAVSLYDWTQLLFQNKLFAEDARIIAFTSEGSSKPWKYYAAVSAAKASLEAISRSIALEFAPFGIKCNCIQAGVTNTRSLQMIPGSENLIKNSIERNPNKRLTTPEDVANVVSLLCKDEANWITGNIIPVDGGEHLQ